MRLFIGIPLEEAVIEALSKTASRLRSKDDGLRWSVAESWHITLQFLGKTNEDQYGCLKEHLRELRYRVIRIHVRSLGFFDRAGVFFAGVAVSPELIELQKRVTAATAHCGFEKEKREYEPHITLSRRRERSGAQSLRKLKGRIDAETDFGDFTAKEFLLYESVPQPGGSKYIVRERFSL